jgi:HTH-type transcriptional regulator / antitoxin HigA
MKDNIKNEENYRKALRRIWDLMKLDPNPDSAEGEELDMLTTLVEAYEEIHYPMGVKLENQSLKIL